MLSSFVTGARLAEPRSRKMWAVLAFVAIFAVGCNHPPLANAGDDMTVYAGSTVTLDGSRSMDVDHDLLTFKWVQTLGEPVAVTTNADGTGTFVAPSFRTELAFDLTAAPCSPVTFKVTGMDPDGDPAGDVAFEYGPAGMQVSASGFGTSSQPDVRGVDAVTGVEIWRSPPLWPAAGGRSWTPRRRVGSHARGRRS